MSVVYNADKTKFKNPITPYRMIKVDGQTHKNLCRDIRLGRLSKEFEKYLPPCEKVGNVGRPAKGEEKEREEKEQKPKPKPKGTKIKMVSKKPKSVKIKMVSKKGEPMGQAPITSVNDYTIVPDQRANVGSIVKYTPPKNYNTVEVGLAPEIMRLKGPVVIEGQVINPQFARKFKVPPKPRMATRVAVRPTADALLKQNFKNRKSKKKPKPPILTYEQMIDAEINRLMPKETQLWRTVGGASFPVFT